ncbi:MAG: peroxidase [Acidobacteria bacterium]|nr:peroxidase [Acidobacteriota bacterium]
MKPMFLPEVENDPNASGPYAGMAEQMKAAGQMIPQIFHLFAFKPSVTEHLARFSQAIMRGPSPLSAGQRELIAAFTSQQNHCPF